MVSLMTALWFALLEAPDRVSVKPHASPVLHAINYLLGRLDREYLTTLRQFGGLQSYPSRTKDPDPVDYSTGSVGIGATAPIWGALAHRYVAGHFDVPVGGRQIALIGDAELDEGAIWEAVADPMVAKLGEVMWVVDLNRQSLDRVVPDIAAGRLAGMFEAAGWHVEMVKYGPRLKRLPELRARIDAMPNEEYQRLLRADAGELRRAARGRRPARRRRRAAGRRSATSAATTSARCSTGFRNADARPRPPERRVRLHDQGLAAADRGPPRQPLRAAERRAVRRAGGGAGHRSRRPVGGVRGRLAGGGAVRGHRGAARARSASRSSSRRPCPRPRAASTRGRESTQQAFGRFWVDLEREAPEVAARVVTVSPDVGTSTNLGGWINKAGIWSIGDRIDWFADDTDTLVRWRECDHGRHIELGIAEVNLVGLLGELGATWSRDGQPLLPVGTIYDPFLARALEPWSFGIYAGGQSILVGTPSGVTLGPEGGAHQSVITPSIGIEQPGCVAWEPAFGRDFEWTFLHALSQLGRPDGSRGLLPAVDAADRPGARGRRRPRARAGRRLPAARRLAGHDRGDGRARAGGDGGGRASSGAEVVCITSADLLFRAFQARAGLGEGDPCDPRASCSPSRSRSSSLVDGHPHTLSFLAGDPRRADRAASACSGSASRATSPSCTSTTRSTPSRWSARPWTCSTSARRRGRRRRDRRSRHRARAGAARAAGDRARARAGARRAPDLAQQRRHPRRASTTRPAR